MLYWTQRVEYDKLAECYHHGHSPFLLFSFVYTIALSIERN